METGRDMKGDNKEDKFPTDGINLPDASSFVPFFLIMSTLQGGSICLDLSLQSSFLYFLDVPRTFYTSYGRLLVSHGLFYAKEFFSAEVVFGCG